MLHYLAWPQVNGKKIISGYELIESKLPSNETGSYKSGDPIVVKYVYGIKDGINT